jgi:hypothetical protein
MPLTDRMGTVESTIAQSTGWNIRLHTTGGYRRNNAYKTGYSFLDDTTNGATHDDVSSELTNVSEQELTEEEEKLVTKMEEIIQFFVDCLKVTGCDLAPEKYVLVLDQLSVEIRHTSAPSS